MTASEIQWWERIRSFPVVALTGISADDLAAILDPLPAHAPAVVFSPPVDVTNAAACLSGILGALERAAIDLFPAWLPRAGGIVGTHGANEAAIRAAARSLAAVGEDFGPFLAELAVHALRGRPSESMINSQQRAAGLARVIARSLNRSRTALVLTLPLDLAIHEQQVLGGVSRWLNEHSALAVWFVGNPLSSVDWINTYPLSMADRITIPVDQPSTADEAAPIRLAVEGQPKPGHESRLAAQLAAASWAGPHVWNRSLDLGALHPTVLPDIRWPDERLIVEVDGPEHRSSARYESDRRRDAALLLHDYAVLRFTNDQIDRDLSYVLHMIRDLLQKRRNP